jgi:hypothetical protein
LWAQLSDEALLETHVSSEVKVVLDSLRNFWMADEPRAVQPRS